MSSNLSRKCSWNRSPRNTSSGIALVSVLWLLLLLSGLAATVAYVARVNALLTHGALDLARAQGAADAAIADTISKLSDDRPDRHPKLGSQWSWEFDSIPVAITLSGEAGRIDVNAASNELLLAFLGAQNVPEDTASTLLKELRAEPLQTIEELRHLTGWRDMNLDCWIPALTVYSGQAEVSIPYATPGALAAVTYIQEHRPNESSRTASSAPVGNRDTMSLLGEVLRLRATASISTVTATREWVGRLTGESAKPTLTMHWDRGTDPVSTASCRKADNERS